MGCSENPFRDEEITFRGPEEWDDVAAEVFAHPNASHLFNENRPEPVLHQGPDLKPVREQTSQRDTLSI